MNNVYQPSANAEGWPSGDEMNREYEKTKVYFCCGKRSQEHCSEIQEYDDFVSQGLYFDCEKEMTI